MTDQHRAEVRFLSPGRTHARCACGWSGPIRDDDGAPHADAAAHMRVESIRTAIQGEAVSWGELAELQALAEYIEPGDLELAEWAGLPEGSR